MSIDASCKDIVEALNKSASFIMKTESISYHEYLDLGLSGDKDSQEKRDELAIALGLPKVNAKTCYKYLNMLGVTASTCKEILGE